MPAIDAVLTTTPRWPSSSGSLADIAAAASRVTLNVPKAFISIVAEKASLWWGVPSRPTVRPAADAATGDVDHDRQGAEALGRLDGGRHGVVVVHVAADRDGRGAELVGQRRGPVGVAVEDGDADAEVDEAADGGGAESTGATGDDRGSSRAAPSGENRTHSGSRERSAPQSDGRDP